MYHESIIKFKISKIRPKSLLGPVKSQKFSRCLCAFKTLLPDCYAGILTSSPNLTPSRHCKISIWSNQRLAGRHSLFISHCLLCSRFTYLVPPTLPHKERGGSRIKHVHAKITKAQVTVYILGCMYTNAEQVRPRILPWVQECFLCGSACSISLQKPHFAALGHWSITDQSELLILVDPTEKLLRERYLQAPAVGLVRRRRPAAV